MSSSCWNLKQFAAVAILGRPMDCGCGTCQGYTPDNLAPDVFRCDRCDRWVSECNGADDDESDICNSCWAYAHQDEVDHITNLLKRVLFKSEDGGVA